MLKSTVKHIKLLGVACSLRNARWGFGSEQLIESLQGLSSVEELNSFLESESDLHLENFMEAGRRDGQDFSEIYRNLKKKSGRSGLSNSEIMLAAALWSALQLEVDVEHLSLAEHFNADGVIKNREGLIEKLLSADALLFSGPVYFGDRGSLSEALIEFIRQTPEVSAHLKGKPYAGLSVGAKRNGGQETALVYQMFDMLNLGLLAVGNDSETTAQYGGTGHAGDIGTMHKDHYGLGTAMGTGRRIARVMHLLNSEGELKTKLRALVIVLREAGGLAHRTLQDLQEKISEFAEVTVIDVTSSEIHRCIACDICPTHVDQDSVYRCIIRSKRDPLKDLHPDLLSHDLMIPIVADASAAVEFQSNYQQFIERTRYLRRGDYVFGDQLVIPILASEVGTQSTYLMRLTTSFIRHHTVLSRPLERLYLNDEVIVDFGDALEEALKTAEQITVGRLTQAQREALDQSSSLHDRRYNPVGYILSAHKAQEDEQIGARERLVDQRLATLVLEAQERIK